MLQPRHGIANRRIAQSGHWRTFGQIKHFISLPWLKPAFETDSTVLKAPLLARQFLAAGEGSAISHDETTVCPLDVHRRIIGQIGERLLVREFVRREDAAHHTTNRAAILVSRPRHLQAQFVGRHIELPADIQQREALRHHRCRQARFATSVRNLHPRRTIAARVVFRPPQPQIGHKAHFARRIHRSQIDIRDDRIARQLRINLEVQFASDLLVTRVADIGSLQHLHPNDSGEGRRQRGQTQSGKNKARKQRHRFTTPKMPAFSQLQHPTFEGEVSPKLRPARHASAPRPADRRRSRSARCRHSRWPSCLPAWCSSRRR